MKKFFSQPKVALIITVVLCLASTLVSTHFRFGNKCGEVTGKFYAGSASSVASELKALCSEAERLVVLGAGYGVDGVEDSKAAVNDIRAQLQNGSSEGKIYDSYETLLRALFDLETALSRQQLSEEDAAILAEAQHNAAECKKELDELGALYNVDVRIFRNQYRFPTPLLAVLSGVRMPQYFE
ncbi:MAG: hypothetical protein K6C08_01180 [Oscillospiraceae bacterium]|nr:hypothetical protein [Oscillospiraceae bacterium]